jgi:molecular chaperone DnaJ
VATDLYDVLGVAREASPDEIKRAYRRLARELHPDVNPDPATQERFKEITAAYEILRDPEKRRMYDRGVDPRSGGPANGFAGFDFSDLMDAFFGGGAAAGGGGGRTGPRSRTTRGADALVRVKVSLEEVLSGVDKELTIDTAVVCSVCEGRGTAPDTEPVTCTMCRGRGEIQSVQRSFLGQIMTSRPCPACQGFGTTIPHPCPECAGDGRVRTRRTVAVRIPPGVDNGVRIQLRGQGEVGPGGGPAADLYVEIVAEPHPVFRREGDDLHCTVPVPMTAAALGTTLELPTLDGTETIDVRPGTQPGTVHRARGKGVPRLNAQTRGDLFVHLDVQVPTKLSVEQESLLQQLAALRGEEQPSAAPVAQAGLFTRLRDAFSGR